MCFKHGPKGAAGNKGVGASGASDGAYGTGAAGGTGDTADLAVGGAGLVAAADGSAASGAGTGGDEFNAAGLLVGGGAAAAFPDQAESIISFNPQTNRFLVKWKGFNEDANTWEPARNLPNHVREMAEARRRAYNETQQAGRLSQTPSPSSSPEAERRAGRERKPVSLFSDYRQEFRSVQHMEAASASPASPKKKAKTSSKPAASSGVNGPSPRPCARKQSSKKAPTLDHQNEVKERRGGKDGAKEKRKMEARMRTRKRNRGAAELEHEKLLHLQKRHKELQAELVVSQDNRATLIQQVEELTAKVTTLQQHLDEGTLRTTASQKEVANLRAELAASAARGAATLNKLTEAEAERKQIKAERDDAQDLNQDLINFDALQKQYIDQLKAQIAAVGGKPVALM